MKRAQPICSALFVACVAATSVLPAQESLTPEASTRVLAIISHGLTNDYDMLRVPQGEVRIMSPLASSMEPADPPHLVFADGYLAILQLAEKNGLVRLRERQQTALEQLGTQGSRFITVTPTPKLLKLQDSMKVRAGYITVPCGTMTAIEIIKEQPYNIQGSTSGDEFRLFLGRMRDTPSPQAASGETGMCGTAAQEFKFRAVLQFNPFAKTYTYVTADYGKIADTSWVTHTVK